MYNKQRIKTKIGFNILHAQGQQIYKIQNGVNLVYKVFFVFVQYVSIFSKKKYILFSIKKMVYIVSPANSIIQPIFSIHFFQPTLVVPMHPTRHAQEQDYTPQKQRLDEIQVGAMCSLNSGNVDPYIVLAYVSLRSIFCTFYVCF